MAKAVVRLVDMIRLSKMNERLPDMTANGILLDISVILLDISVILLDISVSVKKLLKRYN
jgi:hypothetical protein